MVTFHILLCSLVMMIMLIHQNNISLLTLFHAGGGRNPPPPPSIFQFTVGVMNKYHPNHFLNSYLYVIYIIEALSFSYHMSFCNTVTFLVWNLSFSLLKFYIFAIFRSFSKKKCLSKIGHCHNIFQAITKKWICPARYLIGLSKKLINNVIA